MPNASFDEFFRAATGSDPYPYQRRVATEGDRLPDVIDVPPGLGKTAAIVLGWLWRALNSPPGRTPRRLVLALPMRTLTQQAADVIPAWIANLGFSDRVAVEQLVGGMKRDGHAWRQRPQQLQILITTVDMSMSRMLMRGYGLSRGVYPIDAGLLWNDTHVVVDETQLAPASTVTARQIAAFQRQYGSITTGLTCMSATVDRDLLHTVDNPYRDDTTVVGLTTDDETPPVAKRLNAQRIVRELPIKPDNPKALADEIVEHHRPGLTLVIVNTVDTAVEVFKRVKKQVVASETPVLLLHSRFRPADRDQIFVELAKSENAIVISTQVVEAGVDLDARTLITEAAPWPSIIQRSGRCNRAGERDDAELWWFPSGKKSPYETSDLDAAATALRGLEMDSVSNRDLLAMSADVKTCAPSIQTLRRADFLALFDTSPDLTGNDPDISPYIRDADELDVHLVWVDLSESGSPTDDLTIPGFRARCRARISDVKDLLKELQAVKSSLWYYDLAQPQWGKPKWSSLRPGEPVRPGQVFVIDSAAGGYTPDLGLMPKSRTAVPMIDDDDHDSFGPQGGESPGSDGDTSDTGSFGAGGWLTLDTHLAETRDAAAEIVADLPLNEELRLDVILAARLHDIGKAHPTWQNAIKTSTETGPPDESVWAKSPGKRRLAYDGVSSFRHELASVALLDDGYADLLETAHDRDLVCYLIAAHHGKVRVQIRGAAADGAHVLGIAAGEVEIPAVAGCEKRTVTIHLDRFGAVSDDVEVWADMVDRLIARYGVFRLAYMEALVRVADWNASALHDGGSR